MQVSLPPFKHLALHIWLNCGNSGIPLEVEMNILLLQYIMQKYTRIFIAKEIIACKLAWLQPQIY